ncbi:Acyl transferase/acyl hydrolase/lysophospholipase [Penicillium occitanis (nom. inval.)]|nr:hypothetical protein PENOC_053190 [Penicillium occitanis (nom. inval.)]PCH03629.1 Acyl transferase/acyl hydrolase/lysophospholipase [Penicillium occitanis (nom. inval.)]
MILQSLVFHVAFRGIAPKTRYNVDAFYDPSRNKLNTLSAIGGHFLEEDVAAFDAPFFNITAEEAKAMDPTARMLLEVTYEALENAGLPIENLAGSDTSCYVGCFTRDYHEMLMRDAETSPMYAGTGTGFSLLSNRVSWFYDLRGPSMTLDTACSSSLVGMHLACQGLRSKESKIAVVCGANLILSPDLGMWLANLKMTSVDGLSRSFADEVTGYGRGEGIATVILKPLADALKDGDAIRAVIRGTGVNQDGHTTGITLPNSEAQADLINTTYRAAGLEFSQTSYFEAHGTGTAAGDPLELGAVARTISQTRKSDNKLYVGSVKSNIGHLEGAAGLAGVIKCILMLEKGSILPNIHFDRPSKRIPFDLWSIQVPIDVLPWPQDRLKRVSVNSFGYGGTNAHTIIDDAEQFLSGYSGFQDWQLVENRAESDERERLFVFSAPDESALRCMIQRFDDYLSTKASNAKLQNPFERNLFLDRLSYTLSNRRSKFSWKAFATGTTIAGLQEALSTTKSALFKRTPDTARLAFVFTGQGAQWAKMGMELMSYQVFSDSVREADNYLRTHLGSEWSVITELQREKSVSNVHLAKISQPVCTVLQIALVELLKSWNIEPAGVVGHSSGEIAAAYCYGALGREEAWTVAYWRGKICSELKQDAPHVKGAMMAVGLSSEAAEEYIGNVKTGRIVVACINSPSSVTISGDESGIDELQKLLSADAVFCRKLVVENAYHSHHMELIAEKYLEKISTISTSEAAEAKNNQVKMASSVTGELISGPEELGPAYWVKNFVSPVRFSEAVAVLLKDSSSRRRRRARVGESAFDLLLEVGPHAALKGPLRQILRHHEISTVTYTSILNRGEDATKSALHATGELHIHGVPVLVSAVNKQATQTPSPTPLIDLPTYSWNHSLRYWAESRLSKNYRSRKYPRHDLLGAPVADLNDREPRWRNILRPNEQPWMRDHVVYSSILYPGSGMIAMVLEAVQQLAQEREDKAIDSIKLENVRIGKAIVIPEDQTGVETLLQLRRQPVESSGSSLAESWTFTVSSCHEESKLDENSSGMVTVRYQNNSPDAYISQNTGKNLISQVARQEYKIAKTTCTQKINPVDFYDATQAAGLKYGPAFQGLTEIIAGSDRCIGVLRVSDWRKSNNTQGSPHLIHPTTLDIIFHSMFAAIVVESNGTEGKLGFKTAAVPIAFDTLIFYLNDFPPSSSLPEQNTQFSTCCHVKRNADQRDLIADIYVSDLAWEEPKLVVQGIRCRELPGGDAGSSKGQIKAPLGTLLWKPDIEFVGENSLKKFIDKSLSSSKDLISTSGEKNSTLETWEKEVSAIVSLAAHKNPDLSILQIGRSDSLTRTLLSAFSAHDPSNPWLASYTILDKEIEPMAQAQSIFQDFAGLITFYAGDIESGKQAQSLKDDTFDVVIAIDDLKSANEIDHLINCLRNRGSLILKGTKKKDSLGFDSLNHVKTLPGVSILSCSSDTNGYVARKIDPEPSLEDDTIFIVESRENLAETVEVSHRLLTKLISQGYHVETLQWSSENVSKLHGKSIISFLELETPFLSDISEEDYSLLRTVALNSSRLLWVSKGSDPAMQATIGYLRVLQNENVNLDLRYMLLEERADRPAEDIASRVAELAVAPTTDREYMEIDGGLCINRWVVDERLKHVMTSNDDQQGDSTVSVALRDVGDSVLILRHSSNKPDSFWFTADESQQTDLSTDEVEIQVRAIGINHSDTTDSKAGSIKEFSGVVTKIGNSCSKFRKGDRVWTCTLTDSYKTSFRVQESLCQIIPDGVPFEEAALWAVTHTTAYQAVVQLAKVQQGQKVLIQSAGNAIGQIAAQMALQQAAQVYATVASKEQVEAIENIGVPRQNVLGNNDLDLAAAISHLTGGKGLDVIVNQTSTGQFIQQLWSSIAASGVLIDINNSDATSDDRPTLAMAPFQRGASYRVFNLARTLEETPSQMANILQDVLRFGPHRQNFQKPIPWTVFSATTVAEAFNWASKHGNDGKAILTLSPEDNIPVDRRALNPLSLDPNSTYLLAGGLGGLGKSLAKLLAQKGARHLAFVSRSGPASKNAISLTQELADMGVKTAIYAADVSDETAMTNMLAQCAAEMPPILGVIQSAAVLEDSIYDNMTYKQWADATRPKIQGSWLLHHLLEEAKQELQFFVMLSSIAGVVGNRSQANYASGNTYQDALATYRRQLGLPAVSVDLGLMLGIGLIAEERGGTTNLKKWEAVGINEQEFHAVMTAAMAENNSLPAQVICGLPTGGILQSENLDRPFYFDDSRFSLLRRKDVDETLSKQDENDTADSPSSQLSRAESMRDAIDIITTAVCQRLARGLQTAAENIDANKPLHSYGVDSLMAVEIRTWITVNLQADISLFDILSGVSVAALAVKIAAKSKALPEGII